MRIAIRSLASNPRPPNAALIAGTRKVRVWRIRVGDYRVLYEIQDDQMVVLVVRAGHRGEVYRGHRISEPSALYTLTADRPQPHGGRSWASQMLSSDEP